MPCENNKKMEVNDVPVQQFFHEELEKWSEHTNYEKILRLCELMAKDIFGCFDKNRDDGNGGFYKTDRLYCVNNDGERDYIVCDEVEKRGFSRKFQLLSHCISMILWRKINVASCQNPSKFCINR